MLLCLFRARTLLQIIDNNRRYFKVKDKSKISPNAHKNIMTEKRMKTNILTNPIIIIPVRMASTRLPDKPLADIGGKPMIAHVYERCVKASFAPVVVASADKEINDVIEKMGGRAVLTDPDLPSGSDRIFQALNRLDDGADYDAIINVQGDLPQIDPDIIKISFDLLNKTGADISTLVTKITTEHEKSIPSVVKAVVDKQDDAAHGRALYFTRRLAPYGEGAHYHHIGLYGYRRTALEKFVSSPQSYLEKRESLEQLRALSLGMHIEAGEVDSVPFGIDTPEDLENIRKLMGT